MMKYAANLTSAALIFCFCALGFGQPATGAPQPSDVPRLVTQPRQIHGADWLAFSDDNKLLVSTHSTTATAIVWDVESGREIRRFTHNADLVGYTQNKLIVASFSPDSTKLAVFNVREKFIRIWDIASGKLLKQFSAKRPGQKAATAIDSLLSPEQVVFFVLMDKFVSIIYRNELQTWDTATGKLLRDEPPEQELPDPIEMVFSKNTKFVLQWIRKGQFINESLIVADPEKEVEIQRLPIGKYENTATITLDGKIVATADAFNGIINLWNVADAKPVRRLEGYSNKWVFSAFTDSGLYSVSVDEEKARAAIKGSGYKPVLAQLRNQSGGSRRSITTDLPSDGTLSNDDDEKVSHSMNVLGKLGFKFDAWAAGFRMPVRVAANGKTAITQLENKIQIWDLEGGNKLSEITTQTPDERLHVISASGSFAVTESTGQTAAKKDIRALKLYDVRNGTFVRQFDAYYSGSIVNDIDYAAISPDDQYIAYRSAAGTLAITDVKTQSVTTTVRLIGPTPTKPARKGGRPGPNIADVVNGFVFSPDGASIAIATSVEEDYRGGLVYIADSKTGRIVRTLKAPPFTIKALGFSPDGRRLVTGGSDAAVRVWDLATGLQVQSLAGHDYEILHVQYSRDGKFILTESSDQTTRIWRADTGQEICRMIDLGDDGWVTVAPDGRFDTENIEGLKGVHWVLPSDPFTPLPLEIFSRQYYEPGLLRRILKCNSEKEADGTDTCDKEFKPLPPISAINRVPPRLKWLE